MNMLARVLTAFCVVTTLCLAIFVSTLYLKGYLAADRLNAAVFALRGVPSGAADPDLPPARPQRDAGTARELEGLVLMADARERELRQEQDKLRLAMKKGGDTSPTSPTPVSSGPAALPTEAVAPRDAVFQANLKVLQNHTPKVAATLMAEWTREEIASYLGAMKPYEAADILAAMVKMPKSGETDFEQKARDVQKELGR
jgi:hypothetical protein